MNFEGNTDHSTWKGGNFCLSGVSPLKSTLCFFHKIQYTLTLHPLVPMAPLLPWTSMPCFSWHLPTWVLLNKIFSRNVGMLWILNALSIDTSASPLSPQRMCLLYKLCLQPGMFSLPPLPSPFVELRPIQILKHTRHSPLGKKKVKLVLMSHLVPIHSF